MSGTIDGAWLNDAKVIAGVDDQKDQHPLNCTEDGTLQVSISGATSPTDVIVDNIVPVSQSGTWTVNLATEPTIDIGKVDQGTAATLADGWPVKITDGLNVLGTVTNPVNVAGSFAPPALQNVNLTQVNGTPINLGQQLMSASIPVVLASNESALPVTGTFFQATQPISGTVTANAGTGTLLVDGSGHTQPISGSVSVSNFPVTQPISGTVTANQGTSPWVVSGTVTSTPSGTQNVAVTSTVTTPVTGTFFQATQPVSGTVAVNNLPATQPVSGTVGVSGNVTVVQPTGSNLNAAVSNFPVTQAVTGTVAVTQSTSPWVVSGTVTANAGTGTLLVDGSAHTQPVSGTITATQATGTNLHAVLDAGSAVIGHVIADSGSTTAVTGNVTVIQGTGTNLHAVIDSGSTTTVTQATGTNLHTVIDSGTITAVTAITNALPAGSNVIGHVITDTGSTTAVTGNVTVVQPTGTNLHAVLDSGTTTVTQATAANLNATVTQQALTKGTQGSTGITTQDLKDAGRNYVTFTTNAVAGVTSEALFSFTQNKQGTTTGAVTSYTVTNGKTLRITGLYLSNQDGTTTIAWGRALLRHNPAGATTITSPLIAIAQCGGSGALAGATGFALVPFPEGIEIYGNGTQSIGVSHLDQATTNVICCTLVGYEY